MGLVNGDGTVERFDPDSSETELTLEPGEVRILFWGYDAQGSVSIELSGFSPDAVKSLAPSPPSVGTWKDLNSIEDITDALLADAEFDSSRAVALSGNQPSEYSCGYDFEFFQGVEDIFTLEVSEPTGVSIRYAVNAQSGDLGIGLINGDGTVARFEPDSSETELTLEPGEVRILFWGYDARGSVSVELSEFSPDAVKILYPSPPVSGTN